MRTIGQLEKKGEAHFGSIGMLLAIVAVAALLAWFPAWAGQSLSRGEVLHIDARGLDLLLQSDPNLFLVDVRTPDELSGPLGKISRSSNVPLQEIEKDPHQFSHNKTLVLICRSGHRSLEAANLLAEHGYVVYSVDGGMQEWRKLHPGRLPASEGTHAPAYTPETGKPLSGDNKDEQPPKEFFDTGMGC